MISKSERLLIFRFLFSKKSDGYVSIFSLFSIVGISLGVAAIIIVMSVMNGFRIDLTSRIIGLNSHLNIYSFEKEIENDQINNLINQLEQSSFATYYKLIETNGLIIKNMNSKGVLIKGYNNYDANHLISKSLINGELLNYNNSGILIGDALARELNVSVGDDIKIAIPKTDKTILGNIPRYKTLKIIGIFDLGLFEYDSNIVFLLSEITRKLVLLDKNNFNKVEFFVKNPNQIEIFNDEINKKLKILDLPFYPITWKDNNKILMDALKVEKNVMFIILSLIILVASLNIISGLIIFVKEKNKDIGILKTIGMNNISIIKIFFTIGITIGLIGSLFGLIIGIIFSTNIKSIQIFLEKILNTKLFAEEVYYLSSLPSEINTKEVILVLFTSIIISIISTIFPALRSAKIDPIKSIRNE